MWASEKQRKTENNTEFLKSSISIIWILLYYIMVYGYVKSNGKCIILLLYISNNLCIYWHLNLSWVFKMVVFLFLLWFTIPIFYCLLNNRTFVISSKLYITVINFWFVYLGTLHGTEHERSIFPRKILHPQRQLFLCIACIALFHPCPTSCTTRHHFLPFLMHTHLLHSSWSRSSPDSIAVV